MSPPSLILLQCSQNCSRNTSVNLCHETEPGLCVVWRRLEDSQRNGRLPPALRDGKDDVVAQVVQSCLLKRTASDAVQFGKETVEPLDAEPDIGSVIAETPLRMTHGA